MHLNAPACKKKLNLAQRHYINISYTKFYPNQTKTVENAGKLPSLKDIKSRGKADPLQARSGPECSRQLRFPDFMTTAQVAGKVVSLTHRPPLPQEIHLVLISVRGWSTPGS